MQGDFERGGREGRVPSQRHKECHASHGRNDQGTAKERNIELAASRARHTHPAILSAGAVILALISIALTCPNSWAQTDSPTDPDPSPRTTEEAMAPIDLSSPLSLEEVYRLSESRNLSYLRSLESVESSHGSYLSERSSLFPSIGANTGISTSHSRSSRSRYNPITGEINTEESAGTDYSSSLGYTVRMSLIDPPSIFRVRQSSATLDAAEYYEDRYQQNLRNQVEGAQIMALGGALFEELRLTHGRVTNLRQSEYRVPRFSDVPPIDIVLLDRPDMPPAGAGETPMITLAPAIANAIFAACGVWIRALPLIPPDVVPLA